MNTGLRFVIFKGDKLGGPQVFPGFGIGRRKITVSQNLRGDRTLAAIITGRQRDSGGSCMVHGCLIDCHLRRSGDGVS